MGASFLVCVFFYHCPQIKVNHCAQILLLQFNRCGSSTLAAHPAKCTGILGGDKFSSLKLIPLIFTSMLLLDYKKTKSVHKSRKWQITGFFCKTDDSSCCLHLSSKVHVPNKAHLMLFGYNTKTTEDI